MFHWLAQTGHRPTTSHRPRPLMLRSVYRGKGNYVFAAAFGKTLCSNQCFVRRLSLASFSSVIPALVWLVLSALCVTVREILQAVTLRSWHESLRAFPSSSPLLPAPHEYRFFTLTFPPCSFSATRRDTHKPVTRFLLPASGIDHWIARSIHLPTAIPLGPEVRVSPPG